jgi:hypothetical protein
MIIEVVKSYLPEVQMASWCQLHSFQGPNGANVHFAFSE